MLRCTDGRLDARRCSRPRPDGRDVRRRGRRPTSPAPPEGGGASPTPAPGPAGSVRFTIDSPSGRQPISPVRLRHEPDGLERAHTRPAPGPPRRQPLDRLQLGDERLERRLRLPHQNDDYLGGGDTPGEAVRAARRARPTRGRRDDRHGADRRLRRRPTRRGDGDVSQTPDYLDARFQRVASAQGLGASPTRRTPATTSSTRTSSWPGSRRRSPTRGAIRRARSSTRSTTSPTSGPSRTRAIRPTGRSRYAELRRAHDRLRAGHQGGRRRTRSCSGPSATAGNGFVSLQNAPDARGPRLPRLLPRRRCAPPRAARGHRLVDVLDLHWYPEARGGGVRITERRAARPTWSRARVQAPRSLWDPDLRGDQLDRAGRRRRRRSACSRACARRSPRTTRARGSRSPSTTTAAARTSPARIAQADVLGDLRPRGRVRRGALGPRRRPSRFIDAAFAAFRNYDGAGAPLRRHLGRRADERRREATPSTRASTRPRRPRGGRRDQQVHGPDHGGPLGRPSGRPDARTDLSDHRRHARGRGEAPRSHRRRATASGWSCRRRA